MFDRLDKEDSRALKQYIGNFVSHKVVNNGKATVEELNGMSRIKLAREWLEYQSHFSEWAERRFAGIVDLYYGEYANFYDDVALFIDECIPKAFLKYHGGDNDKSPAQQKIVCDENGKLPFGLVYHFSENLPAEIQDATEKQLKYLEKLACSECIDYFLNMDYKLEPKCFLKHFKPTM